MTDASRASAAGGWTARPLGAVVIPAHDEEQVIGRTLAPLSEAAVAGLVEVVVVPNGCRDDTAAVARSVPGMLVEEVAEASKTVALNRGDDRATAWPRLYLDADISITPEAVVAVFDRLREGAVLAARPAFRYQTDDATPLVRRYYRARSRIPALSSHLWGAGAYALSERAHARLGRFPSLIADDLYVDDLFDSSEIAIVDCEPVLVQTPRTARALLQVLRRVYLGKAQLVPAAETGATGGAAGLRRALSVARSGPELADAVVYCAFAVVARLLALRGSDSWLRDETSRAAPPPRSVTVS